MLQKMASRSKTTVFDYYTYVSESDGCVEGKCGSCSTKRCQMLPKNLETLLFLKMKFHLYNLVTIM